MCMRVQIGLLAKLVCTHFEPSAASRSGRVLHPAAAEWRATEDPQGVAFESSGFPRARDGRGWSAHLLSPLVVATQHCCSVPWRRLPTLTTSS